MAKERLKAGFPALFVHAKFKSARGNVNQTPILRRLALRAFELAGRRPWFALFTLRVVLAMTVSSPSSLKTLPRTGRRGTV